MTNIFLEPPLRKYSLEKLDISFEQKCKLPIEKVRLGRTVDQKVVLLSKALDKCKDFEMDDSAKSHNINFLNNQLNLLAEVKVSNLSRQRFSILHHCDLLLKQQIEDNNSAGSYLENLK